MHGNIMFVFFISIKFEILNVLMASCQFPNVLNAGAEVPVGLELLRL